MSAQSQRLRAGAASFAERRMEAPASRSLGRPGIRRRRQRRLAGLVRFAVFLLLVFVVAWAGARVAHAGVDAGMYEGHQYEVQSGDTLWAIAADEYGDNADLREAVDTICDANDLQATDLQPGQTLTLPYLEQ